MLMGLGSAEIVIALPVLVAAILGNSTPTAIAMAAYVTFHGLIGLTAGTVWYIARRPDTEKAGFKHMFRIAFIAMIGVGIALGIATAIHGGVGSRVGYYYKSCAGGALSNRTALVNTTPSQAISKNSAVGDHARMDHALLPMHEIDTKLSSPSCGEQVWYYNYRFDVFYGVFIAIFEILCLLAGLWFLDADKKKAKKSLLLANTPRSSFANLQAALKSKRDSQATIMDQKRLSNAYTESLPSLAASSEHTPPTMETPLRGTDGTTKHTSISPFSGSKDTADERLEKLRA